MAKNLVGWGTTLPRPAPPAPNPRHFALCVVAVALHAGSQPPQAGGDGGAAMRHLEQRRAAGSFLAQLALSDKVRILTVASVPRALRTQV
jgi:hypothetical protein